MLRKVWIGKWALFIVILLMVNGIVFAQGSSITNFTVPYNSYIYDYWGDSMPGPQAYLPSKIIYGDDLQVGSLRNPNDLFITQDGKFYIADTGNHRIIVADQNLGLLQMISSFGLDNQETFNTPSGIFVTDDGDIYVADTGNARIVHLDSDGNLKRFIGEPRSSIEGVLPTNFSYRPLKVGVDRHGRIYVVSRDLFEGFISFSEDGQFRGFVGAPRVTPKFSDYIWSRFATKEQRQRMQAFLPTEYTGFDLDSEGFLYAVSHDEDKEEDEGGIATKIRKLNPKGEDLLRRLGFDEPMGDVEFPDQWSQATRRTSSRLVDITVQDYGVYSVLDANRGRVFTYDNNGNLLYVFGYLGTDDGQVRRPTALEHFGKTMFILDSETNSITVYEPSDYALLIWAALDAYDRGDYAQTELIWGKVLAMNANNDLAYTGIGRTLLRREQYEEAMKNFKLGQNRAEYSKAFELYRKELIYANFATYFWIILAIIVLLVVVRKFFKDRKIEPTVYDEVAVTSLPAGKGLKASLRRTAESLKFSLNVIVHPIDGFERLKKDGMGTVPAATIILGLVVASFVFSRQYTGFIFNTADLSKINLLMEIGSVVVPFLLWCMVNWALTTLMEGKGTFKDVYIATGFALVPVILTVVPLTIVSNFLIAEEGTFYQLFMTLGLSWAVILLIVGAVMVTHNYSFKKTVFTCISTIMGMAFALFIGMLFVSLSEQVILFVRQVVTEVVHRT